jgi:HD superfamily phosphohydrolase
VSKKIRKVRDPIHGFIEFTQEEAKIIDLPLFQRLRRIRQLAMAHLVYPGALHTRFDHSLGTMHLAGRIAESLRKNRRMSKEDVRLVRLAMLLHDAGHGPFSHVSEGLLAKHAIESKVAEKWQATGHAQSKIHELVTLDFILQDEELAQVLSQDDRNQIARIIWDDRTKSIKRDIVSSSLDADKLDYVKRDAHFTGVQYGVYDLDKIIESIVVANEGGYETLAIDESAAYAVEQLILAKHHMTVQVYRHKVRCITDAMIEEGLNKAIEEGNPVVQNLYRYDGSKEWLKNYRLWGDEKLLQELSEDSRYPVSQDYFRRLRERRLFKRVFECPVEEIRKPVRKDRFSDPARNASLYAEVRAEIAKGLKEPEDYVLVRFVGIKDPTFRVPGQRLSPEEIMVQTKEGLQRFTDLFYLLVNKNTSQSTLEYLHVYARRDQWDGLTSDQKQRKYKEVSEKIKPIINPS